jgi:hypothetical protein
MNNTQFDAIVGLKELAFFVDNQANHLHKRKEMRRIKPKNVMKQ